MITDEIQKILKHGHVPVWGATSAVPMENEPPGHRPSDLLPGAQSLVCFGIPVSRDVYRMRVYRDKMVWRSQNLHYRKLDTISLQISVLLEERGHQAVPIYGCMPLGVNEKGVVVGYLNQIRMGEVAGIGVIGKNGLLLNSRYGSRLMLGGVITTARLSKIRHPETEEPGCPEDCQICVDACPVRAILLEDSRVRVMRCLGYTARTPLMSKLRFFLLSKFRPDSAGELMSISAFDELTYHICSECVSLCPYDEEQEESHPEFRE